MAICLERSFDWIIAALGTMRIGAAYVPLDPGWPDARLRFAVHDSGATALVARAPLLDRLQIDAVGVDPCLDASAISAAAPVAQGPLAGDSVAYVIYTSGSTGTPKGVEITHSNLAHLIRWHREEFNVTREDRASHLAGLGFDASVWEVWPYLSVGATVCLASDEVRSSPELIQEWMIREGVTIGFVPTVHTARMVTMKWPATTRLRVLLTGGDALQRGPAFELPFTLVNNYGPAECTVVATSSVVKPGSQEVVPIGFPITGASVYLLDENGEPVPDGGVGEIYIGGGGVGRGYRNLPELTARSFVTDPFSGVAGSRMYRTGDRGVRRADGEIEFRGRLDRQTKIRGQRVELDEIGSILTDHAGVNFATVTSNITEAGENQLVAYVLPENDAAVPSADELQKYLRDSLPDYMVPKIFVRLSMLPLSPNAKLDLTLLPKPTEKNQMKRTATNKAAGTAVEDKLLGIVQNTIGDDAVALEDNFLLAGGHSLLGMQLIMRIRNAFGVDLALRQIFEAPTIKRLALLIETKLSQQRLSSIWADLLGGKQCGLDDNFFEAGGNQKLVTVLQQRIATEFGQRITMVELISRPTIRRQAELTLSFVKEKPKLPPGVVALQPNGTRKGIFWVHYLCTELAKKVGEDQPFFFVGLTAEDLSSLGEAPTVQSIAACLVGKIAATQAEGPYAIGGLCLGGILAYEIASQLHAAGREVSLLALLDPPSPPYLKSRSVWAPTLRHPSYLIKRAAQLGVRTSLQFFRDHLQKRLIALVGTKSPQTEMTLAQQTIKTATTVYSPASYEGKVLLLLASDHPPHVNFLPGWQALVPGELNIRYLDGHHRDLLKEPHVRGVADAILSHLATSTDEAASVSPAGAPDTSFGSRL